MDAYIHKAGKQMCKYKYVCFPQHSQPLTPSIKHPTDPSSPAITIPATTRWNRDSRRGRTRTGRTLINKQKLRVGEEDGRNLEIV
jgi:hypothetical protein